MRVLGLVLVAACTATATIPDNVCGNGVLEPGEDCDAPGDPACTSTCRIACAIVAAPTACTAAPDGTCCPTGARCGVDGVCHAPSGQVTSELIEPYDVTTMVLADIDGDHIADAVGVNNSQIEVRYGDAQAPLERAVIAPSPVSSGATAFGDMTGDGRIDVVVPTAGGLFAFETSTGAPEPIPFPAKTDTGLTHLRIAATPGEIVTLDYLASSDVVVIGAVSRDFATTAAASVRPCKNNEPESGVRARQIHPYLDGGRTLVPLQFSGGVCVAVDDGSGTGQFLSSTTTNGLINTKPDTIGETFLAPVLGNVCPDLLISVETASGAAETIVYAGVGTTGSCAVTTTAPAATLPGVSFATMTLALSSPQTAVVTSVGLVDPTTQKIITAAPRAWTYALVTDLDGDGRDDVVTTGTSTDVEALLQRQGTTIPELADIVIQTTDTAQYIATGDFDGDGHGDIAIGTIDPTNATSAADLEIAWGGASGGFDVTDVGTFAEPHDVVATNLVDPSLPPGFDQFDDLILANGGIDPTDASDPSLLIAEYGSTSRGLTAPFVFESRFGAPAGDPPQRGTGKAAVIGDFGANGGPGAFAVFAAPQTAPDDHTGVDLTATSYGDFTPATDAPFSSCGAAGSDGDAPFCIDDAHLLRVARTAPALDVALGIRTDVDAGALTQCMAYATTATSTLATVSCADLATANDPNAADELAGLVDVTTARVIIDGATDLLFLGHAGTDTESAVAWTLTADADGQPHLTLPIDFNAELTAVVATGDAASTAHCMDAVGADLGTRTVNGASYGADDDEIVLACVVGDPGAATTQLWARYAAADPSQPPSYALLEDLGKDEVIHLHEGDANGDGLVDIAYTFGAAGAGKVELHVLFQCDTHQTGCQGGT